MNIPNLAPALLARLLASKGGMVSVQYQTHGSPAADFKAHSLRKVTTAVRRVGAEFRNLAPVREAIEAGERSMPEAPKGKEWVHYPYILRSLKDPSVHYVRTYHNTGTALGSSSSTYYIDGQEATKEAYEAMLPASRRSGYKPFDPSQPADITTSNLLAIKIDGEWVRNS